MNEKKFLKEKENLLNSIENNTSEHWKNYYKDVPIEYIYDDLVIDINEIKRLTEENQQLNQQLKTVKTLTCFNMPDNVEVICLTKADYERNKSSYETLDLYKSVIDEIREYIIKQTTDEETGEDLGYSDNIDYEYLLEILDKANNKDIK